MVARNVVVRGAIMYYWREPNKDFKSGLKILEHDAAVFEMIVYAVDVGEIDVYVRHLSKDELKKIMNPRKGVVIEELADDNEVESTVQVVTGGRAGSVNASSDGVEISYDIGILENNIESPKRGLNIEDDDFDGVMYILDDEAEPEISCELAEDEVYPEDEVNEEDEAAEREGNTEATYNDVGEHMESAGACELNEIGQTDIGQSEQE